MAYSIEERHAPVTTLAHLRELRLQSWSSMVSDLRVMLESFRSKLYQRITIMYIEEMQLGIGLNLILNWIGRV